MIQDCVELTRKICNKEEEQLKKKTSKSEHKANIDNE